ncbi:hypothetical protein [Christensenella timonensis]|uniref:hypothetical protein n=1 Tax=Christensenella timonensis TaxID=1816678 RepID=UPI0011C78FE7|nr:hypothetical protein [Christensenella timonensis]
MGNDQHSERDARIRRQEEERARQKREAERRRKEEERRRKEEEERKRQEEEERKRRQQEAEERAKQAALEAAQSGWQPPQGNGKTAATQAAQFGWQPPQMQKQEGEKEGAPQAQGKPYARTLMDNVLAHEGDTGDPFLMELNRDSWEQEYREGRIKAFKEAVGQLAGQLMSGEVKPAEGTGKQGNWTDGDLSDPFLQGLFGEEELKKEFVQGQMEQFMPALERRIAQLRGKVSGQTEEEPQQKDTAYGTNMVYTMDKDDKKASTEAAQSGWQPPQGNDKKASTEAAQFGWQPPQEPLPESFHSLDDLRKLVPNEVVKSLFDIGVMQEAWDSMTKEQQDAVLRPWVQGNEYELSPGAQKTIDNVRDVMHSVMMGDDDTRAKVLMGIGMFSDSVSAARFLSQPFNNEMLQQIEAAAVRKAFADLGFEGTLPADKLIEASQVVNAIAGMQVDENGVWHSTGTGLFNVEGGYADEMDKFAEGVLGFDLKTDTVPFSVMDKNNKEHHYQLRGWSGGYGSLFGGEFGLYEEVGKGDWAKVDDNRFHIDLTVKDKQGNELFTYSSGDEIFWQYAAMHPEDMAGLLREKGYSPQEADNIAHKLNAGDVVVEGRLTGKSKDDVPYLRAMTQAIGEQNKQNVQDALLSGPFGGLGYALGGEAEQIKATDGGYTADGMPYVVISFNQPWYMGGKKK